MGLDMYLNKRKRLDVYDFNKDECTAKKVTVTVKSEFADGEVKEQEYVVDNPDFDGRVDLPFMYWRKANAIHAWILRATKQKEDNCKPIEIYGDKLIELAKACKTVLDDHTKAEELLPTQEGFFFGSTDYDEYYYRDLQDTYEKFKDVNPNDCFIYQASW